MTIEWNRVTWYSKALAVLVFVGTFALAFWLGMSWQRAQEKAPIAAAPAGGTAGASCGGFIQNAPVCATGFHCQLDVSRPDTGRICVPDQTDIKTPSWTKGMTLITQNSNGETIHLAQAERFAIQFGDGLDWTLSFDPKGIISRVPNSIDTDGFQGVYAADKTGTTTLTAVGKPYCAPGMMCAQYLVEVAVTLTVGS